MMFCPLRCVVLMAVALIALSATAWAEFPTRIKADGSLVLATPGVLTTRADGRVFQVKIKPDTAIEVAGKLPLQQLKNGMIIRVTAPLSGSEFEGEIAELKVHTPADGYQQGLLQDSEDEPPTLIGQVLNVRNGTLTILAARKRYTAALADDLDIVLETKDYRVASRGDTVHFEGYLSPDKVNVTAKKIEITLQSHDNPNIRR